MKMKWLPSLLLVSATIHCALAQDVPTTQSADHPFLSAVFGDNMVLQRDQKLPFWGWTTPGQHVTVSAQGKTADVVADAQGYWRANLPALHLGSPIDVIVKGPQTETLHNVLVGDVWVCSGQSNMEFGIGNANNAEQEIAAANQPDIRLFTVLKKIALDPQTRLGRDDAQLMGQWSVCTPQTVRTGGWNGFSAVGYFFGQYLHQALHVPIGLIHTSWGGTPIQAWTSAEALQTIPDEQPLVAQVTAEQAAEKAGNADYATRVADWYRKADPGSATGNGWADPAYDASAWKTMPLPQYWETAGIPALASYDGVLWYRKEVTLPAGSEAKPAVLHLGAIDDNDTTWVNGVQVGATEGYDKPRDYTVPTGTLKAGPNVIAVRVLDTGGNGGLWGKPTDMHLDVDGAQPVPLAGDWDYDASAPLDPKNPLPVRTDNNPNFPTVLYNGMISPLLPDAIKGAIWYQGESNAGEGYRYRTLLPTMIGDWRKHWDEGNFPFYIVQLAGWQPGGDSWPELREAQWLTAKNTPNTGIATAIDIGDQNDIHPKDKQDVGRRLALAALAQTYGQKVEYSGPVYKGMKQDGSAVRLTFDHLGGGLVMKGATLTGFTIAGADRKFVAADARIDGNAVIVSSTQVTDPVAVRYAWSSYPACSLYNKAGLPAWPFRTDDWPGTTAGQK